MGEIHDAIIGVLVEDLRGNIIGEIHGSNDDEALIVRPVRCRGCLVRDVPAEGLSTYRLCRTCMDDALTYIVLRDLVVHHVVNLDDYAIERAIDHLENIDARARARGGQHIDAHASAWDSIQSTPYTDVRDRLFTLLQRAMHDHVMIPNP